MSFSRNSIHKKRSELGKYLLQLGIWGAMQAIILSGNNALIRENP